MSIHLTVAGLFSSSTCRPLCQGSRDKAAKTFEISVRSPWYILYIHIGEFKNVRVEKYKVSTGSWRPLPLTYIVRLRIIVLPCFEVITCETTWFADINLLLKFRTLSIKSLFDKLSKIVRNVYSIIKINRMIFAFNIAFIFKSFVWRCLKTLSFLSHSITETKIVAEYYRGSCIYVRMYVIW